MATSKEKDAVIKSLKEKVKSLTDALSSTKGEGDLSQRAFGIDKQDGVFYLREIKYDPETGASKVVESKSLGKDYSIALYLGKEYLVKKILIQQK